MAALFRPTPAREPPLPTEQNVLSVARYFHAQACNNAWANHRLLSACEQLSLAEFTERRTSFFPTLQATLNHNLIVDWYYVDALEGGSLGLAAFEPEIPVPDAAELRVAQAQVDQRLIALCAKLCPADLTRLVALQRQTHTQTERLDRVLLHLFQHQVHHRGQAHAMLSGTGVRPPQLDEFFMAAEAELRAREFSELGLSEASVWGGGG